MTILELGFPYIDHHSVTGIVSLTLVFHITTLVISPLIFHTHFHLAEVNYPITGRTEYNSSIPCCNISQDPMQTDRVC